MGKCYIDSINDKIVFNGSSIAFNEFTKYKNGKILTLDGVEIIDSTLLSRLTVTGGKLALDGILVNGLNLSSITSDILPTTTTTLNLGSTGLKFSNVWSSVINTSTLKIDTASITFDGTVLKLGTDTLATREWVNSSAIPVLKTINGQSITGTGDITIVGGSGSGGSTFMDIQYAMMTGGVTVQAPSVFIPFATNIGDSSLDYVYKVDDSTVLIKAGVLYKLEGNTTDVTDNDADYGDPITFGLYSDIAGVNGIKTLSNSTEYLASWSNAPRSSVVSTYIKSDVNCYLKLKAPSTLTSDSSGFSLNVQTTITKYNTTPILTDANGSYTQGRQELPGYSATETLTEKRWIDGKPIYRKVCVLGNLSSLCVDTDTYQSKTLGISDYGTTVYANMLESNYEGDTSYFLSNTSHRSWKVANGNLYINASVSQSYMFDDVTILVEYTKSTDTAGSPVALVGGVQDSFVSKFVGCNVNAVGSTQSLPVNTSTKILFTNKVFDTNSAFDTTNSRYVAPVSGYYQVNGSVTLNDQQTVLYGFIMKNGSEIARMSGGSGNMSTTSGSSVVYCNKGDYIEIYAYAGVVNTLQKLQTSLQVSLIAPNYGGQNTLPNYSTTETLTSERWIDGKPIYRTVVLLGNQTSLANDSAIWKSVTYNTDKNVESTVMANVLFGNDDEQLQYWNGATSEFRYVASATQFQVASSINNSSGLSNVKVVCYYTKTTDTASSPVTTIGGSGTPKKYFARISNGTATSFLRGVTTQIPLSTFGKGDQELHNGTSGFIAPQDDVYTITGQFYSYSSTQANINEITIFCYVNGVEEGRALLNPGATGGFSKGCNITVNTRLNKNDVVTFGMYCWSSDTTTSLSVPVGSLVATIRN